MMFVQVKRRNAPLSYTLLNLQFEQENGGAMKQLEHLSEAEKDQLMVHLGRIYRKGALQLQLGLHGMVEDCEADRSDLEIASRIRLILRGMEKQEALILIQDYFEIRKSDWWKELYSQETYLMKKRCATDAFLRCLYA